MGKILLIAADWRFRALVRAQLLEEGYAVRALPSLQVALTYLVHSGERPRLTILDAHRLETKTQTLSGLWQLSGGAPLILCGGLLSRQALTQEGLPPAQVLLRPFRVGDLVEQVRRVLTWPGNDTPAE